VKTITRPPPTRISLQKETEQLQKLLQDMLSFPMKNNLKITESSNSALKTPNDMYKDLLLQRIKTYKEQTSSEE